MPFCNFSMELHFQLNFTGIYECTLNGKLMDIQHRVEIPKSAIKQAPNVRLQNEIHVKCEEGQTQNLECCVQSSYRVKWYQDTNILFASKSWNANYFVLNA